MIQAETITITTLSENTVSRSQVTAEWGLSIHVAAGGKNILLDAGGGEHAAKNAEKLGIDLGELDAIVLSHSHFDHTGGLPDVLAKVKKRFQSMPSRPLGEEVSSQQKNRRIPLHRHTPCPRVS